MKVWAGVIYNLPSASLIFSLKYQKNPWIAEKMAQWIVDQNIVHWNYDYLTYVPMQWYKYLWRGYNQSYLLAYFLSKKTNIPVIELLSKVDHQSQTNKNYDHRLTGPKFLVVKPQLPPSRILIIDDVLTTGTTLYNINQLLQNEPYGHQCHGLVFAASKKFFNISSLS
jgi:predicted amidophosphoribosyltransferase